MYADKFENVESKFINGSCHICLVFLYVQVNFDSSQKSKTTPSHQLKTDCDRECKEPSELEAAAGFGAGTRGGGGAGTLESPPSSKSVYASVVNCGVKNSPHQTQTWLHSVGAESTGAPLQSVPKVYYENERKAPRRHFWKYH